MPVSHAAQSRLSSSRLHAGTRVVQPGRCLQRPRYSCTPRAGLTEVGRYLAEAASCMLQPQADTVPWSGGAFTGSVRHHEGDVQRLKRLYEVVKSTRQQMSGCMDPSAANYDPNAASDDGTCNYLFEDEVSGTKVEGNLVDFMNSTLRNVWTSKGDHEPDWSGTGYSFSGRSVSQRDIDRLVRYEAVVKETLQKAEAKEKAQA